MALRDVNLIPDEFSRRGRSLRHLGLWGAILAVSLLLTSGCYAVYVYGVLPRSLPAADLAAARREMGTLVAGIREAEDELDRLSFVGRITGARPYSGILWRLAQVMRESTWLGGLLLEASGPAADEYQLVLNGFATSNGELGALLKDLSQDEAFGRVQLKFSKETARGTPQGRQPTAATIIGFEIRCRMSGRSR